MARLILLKEDYGGTVLYLTDLEDNQLEIILKQMLVNDENGVGEDAEDIAKRFYPDNTMKNLCDTDSGETDIIKELDFKCVAECNYYGFCEVVNNEVS